MEDVKSISEKLANGTYALCGQRKGRSFVWNILAEIQKEDNSIIVGFVYCRTCTSLLRYVNGQTSNLIRHICCKALKDSVALKAVSAKDKSEAVDMCTAWIAEDCRPFSAVSGAGFLKMVNFFLKMGATYGEHVDVEDMLPDPTTISRNVQKVANQKKNELKDEICNIVCSGGASATINMWTDNYVKRNFLGVTLHYLKDYELIDMVVGMKSMDFERSTSDDILKKLKSLFYEFGVDSIEPIKFVTDREVNIVRALDSNVRINCSSHLLSNVLEKSFSATRELEGILESSKKIVKYIKKANLEHLLQTSLKSQCPTRWNSHYRMLKSINDNWEEIIKILSNNEESSIILNINHTLLKSVVDICEKFEIIFKKLQLTKSPSLCYVLPSILTIKSFCQPIDEELATISTLKNHILRNIDEIWLDNLGMWHKAAFFLYPPAINMQNKELKDIKKFCSFHMQIAASPQFISPLTPSIDSSTPQLSFDINVSPDNNLDSVCPSDNSSNDTFFFSNLMEVSTSAEGPEDEVEKYCKEIVNMSESFHLMSWWQNHENKYPNLYLLAMQILSIPASSAAAERSFSLAGNIITEKRNRLGPGVVDSLVFLNSVYKNEDI